MRWVLVNRISPLFCGVYPDNDNDNGQGGKNPSMSWDFDDWSKKGRKESNFSKSEFPSNPRFQRCLNKNLLIGASEPWPWKNLCFWTSTTHNWFWWSGEMLINRPCIGIKFHVESSPLFHLLFPNENWCAEKLEYRNQFGPQWEHSWLFRIWKFITSLMWSGFPKAQKEICEWVQEMNSGFLRLAMICLATMMGPVLVFAGGAGWGLRIPGMPGSPT